MKDGRSIIDYLLGADVVGDQPPDHSLHACHMLDWWDTAGMGTWESRDFVTHEGHPGDWSPSPASAGPAPLPPHLHTPPQHGL